MKPSYFLAVLALIWQTTSALVAQGPPRFHVEVQFDGLIAWVDGGNPLARYALLVDAEPPNTSSDDFPRCAWEETSGNLQTLEGLYPPHYAHVRFLNAAVDKHNGTSFVALTDPVKGESLKGMEILLQGGADLPARDVAPAVRKALIESMRPQSSPPSENFKVANGMLTVDVPTLGFLAARVSMRGGAMMTSRNPCRELYPQYDQRLYSFVLSQEVNTYDCENESGTSLVEETTWTTSVDGGEEYFYIRQGDPSSPSHLYRIKPIIPRQPAVIQILNSVKDAIDNPGYDGCLYGGHLDAFRWFYRLTKESTTAACSDLGEEGSTFQYFPCETRGGAGGTKCPQIGLDP